MKVRFTNIQWDTDGMSLEACELPTETILEVDQEEDMNQYLEDEGANLLSDQYGFCVDGCSFEIIS